MKNYDKLVEINYNPNWTYIPDHPEGILIITGSGSGKTNVLLILIKHHRPIDNRQRSIDKIYLLSKIHLNQSINYLSTEEKKLELKN